MIANTTEYEKTQEEIRSLEQRLKRLQENHPIGSKGFTKAGIHKMIARLHEELAVYEGSEEARRPDPNEQFAVAGAAVCAVIRQFGRKAMLQYKAGYKYVTGGVHAQVLDFPAAITCAPTLPKARILLGIALLDVALAAMESGGAIPAANPAASDREMDIEEPISLYDLRRA
jgi:hypothetical protein